METNFEIAYEQMVSALKADERFLPSAFWSDLNQKNLEMLREDGVANFKRTVSQNYFNWMVERSSPMFRQALKHWLSHPSIWPLLTRIQRDVVLRFYTRPDPVTLTSKQLLIYRLFVSFIWEIMLRHDRAGLHKLIEEPTLGNPIRVKRNRRLITQDLANSIIEANLLLDLPFESKNAVPRIAEVGAGYGRLAHVLVGAKRAKYFIFDIPPALNVAQWYLTTVLQNARVFQFRGFDRFDAVEDELAHADVAFFTANQLELFPDGYFDAVVSISTLPEMRIDQVGMYLGLFQRLAGQFIFVKQWKRWLNPQDGTDIRVEDYLFGSDWKMIVDQTDPVVPEFFNRVWSRTASD